MADLRDSISKDRSSRACVYCNKSKTKCIWPGEAGIGNCNRCARLHRDCTLPQPREKRRRGPSTRVGQLEQKIDDILSLLHATTQQTQQKGQSAPPESSSSRPTESESDEAISSTSSTQTPIIHPVELHGPLAHSTRTVDPETLTAPVPAGQGLSPAHGIEIIPGFKISVERGDELLSLYRKECSDQFPFVPIRGDTKAIDLFEERPFLFRTIVQTICPQTPALQSKLSRWFRIYIAEHVIVDQEKRVELLQALLLYIAWGNSELRVESPNSSLLQIAVRLVVSLGHKGSFSVPRQGPDSVSEKANRQGGPTSQLPHSLDDIRAFLGCCYLSTLTAVFSRQSPETPLPSWYISMCCNALESGAEYESDTSLVAVMKMQDLMWRADVAFPKTGSNEPPPASLSARTAMSTLQTELEKVKDAVPTRSQNHWCFQLTYHGTLMCVHEPAIRMWTFSGSTDIRERGRRNDVLWCCLDAIKAFFDAFVMVPVEELGYLPVTMTSWLSFVTCTATNFLLLNDSDWNPPIVCKGLDLLTIAWTLSNRHDQADRVAAGQEWRRKRRFSDQDRPLLVLYGDKMRSLASHCQSKLMPVQ